MKKLHKSVLCLLMLLGFYAPQVFAQIQPTGIAPRNMKQYNHAKQVLEQQCPDFLTGFQALQKQISTINYADKKAQTEAFMQFLPAIEDMADITSFDTWDREDGRSTLQSEVIFTFFSIHLPTADEGHYTTVFEIFCDAFMLNDVHSEAIRMLSEDEIMQKHSMSRQEAQRILNVWDKLHRDWPW